MSIELTCEKLFDGFTLHGPRRLVIDSGVIQSISPFVGTAEFELLSPGFVDVQMNGFDKWDVSVCDVAQLEQLDDTLASLGTTSWLGTIVTAPLERLSTSIERLQQAFISSLVRGLRGVHVEGPFLGSSPGAHNPKWIVPFDFTWIATLPECVQLVTLAAEQNNAAQAVTEFMSRNIHVSIGHSQPTTDEFESVVNAGASLVTHLYNGMSGVHHRNDGLALMAMTNDKVRAGLIADLVHVSPNAISLAFRAKGPQGVCLVSDSIAWRSEWATARDVEVRDGAPRLPDGTLAGTSTPLAQCVANVVNHCGVPLENALQSATSTPARTVGLENCGFLAEGAAADVVALREDLSVVNTWRRLPSVRA